MKGVINDKAYSLFDRYRVYPNSLVANVFGW